jgi:hypothetical protein
MNKFLSHIIKFFLLICFVRLENTAALAQTKDSADSYAIRKDVIDIYCSVFRAKSAVRGFGF